MVDIDVIGILIVLVPQATIICRWPIYTFNTFNKQTNNENNNNPLSSLWVFPFLINYDFYYNSIINIF